MLTVFELAGQSTTNYLWQLAYTAYLTIVAEYCRRICCCERLLAVKLAAPGTFAAAATAALAAAGLQKVGSHSAVSTNDAVMSTPKGTRPRARHASTCSSSAK
jgi:hypothetical protein